MSSRFARSSRAAHVRAGEIPASPPSEVLDAVAAALAAYERLDAAGQRVRFDLDETSGRLLCELTDADGALLRSLSARAVLDLAAGGSPD